MKLTNQELDKLLAQAGLRMAQPYNPACKYRKDEFLFTVCNRCGTEAHYRLKYILDKSAQGERVCRACYWLAWYGGSQKLYDEGVRTLLSQGCSRAQLIKQGAIRVEHDLSWHSAEQLAREHNFELIDLLHGNRPGDDVLIVRCKACGRQTAERPGDVEFGCSCRKTDKKGVAFGQEAHASTVPISEREVAPFSPSGASIRVTAEHRAVEPRRYSFEELRDKVVTDIPELLAAWDDEESPEGVSVVSSRLRHFRCHEGHRPNQTPYSFLVDGCMVCRGLRTKAASRQVYLRESNPELSEEWLEARDGSCYTPDTVKSGSKRMVRWRCMACGHEWEDTVRNREKRMYERCPACGKIMGSFAWRYPDLAREWSGRNPLSPWNIKPFSKLVFTPEWVSETDPRSVWRESIASRLKRSGGGEVQ